MYLRDPIDRWYVSRWVWPATVEDFTQAVQGMGEELENATGDKFDLKIAFYKAAAPDQLGTKPDVLVKEVSSLREVSARQFRKADYVEATFTARTPDRTGVTSATVTARWPDSRQIDFQVAPKHHADDVSRRFIDSRFLLFTRGIKTGP